MSDPPVVNGVQGGCNTYGMRFASAPAHQDPDGTRVHGGVGGLHDDKRWVLDVGSHRSRASKIVSRKTTPAWSVRTPDI